MSTTRSRKLHGTLNRSVDIGAWFFSARLCFVYGPWLTFAFPDVRSSADVTLTILFVLEIILKVLHLGFYKWLGDSWNIVDGVIVLCALLSYAPIGANNLGATRGLRAMRVLKPLRTLRKFHSLKATVTTFIQSIPPTMGVVVMIIFNWLILGILGVQTLGGKLNKCSDPAIVTNALCVGENRTLGPH